MAKLRLVDWAVGFARDFARAFVGVVFIARVRARSGLQVRGEGVHPSGLGAGVALKVKVLLLALLVRHHGEAAVVSLRSREHDPLGT